MATIEIYETEDLRWMVCAEDAKGREMYDYTRVYDYREYAEERAVILRAEFAADEERTGA